MREGIAHECLFSEKGKAADYTARDAKCNDAEKYIQRVYSQSFDDKVSECMHKRRQFLHASACGVGDLSCLHVLCAPFRLL